MISIFRLKLKGIFITAALAFLAAAVIAGCAGKESDIAEAGTEAGAEDYILLEPDTEPETEAILRMAVDFSVLPILEGVTTAADNAVLSPVILNIGDEHRVVRTLQERLMGLGFMDNDDPTTYYGNSTAEAVSRFERQLGLTQDGTCGTELWDLIFAGDAPYYMVKNGDDGNDIVEIQDRLYELGYLTLDSVTGHFGDKTEEAVRKMQERNGLTVDGTMGMESINLLYSDSVVANLIGLGEQSDLVREYQQRLIDLGYLRNEEADGSFGAATEDAVEQFQSRNDLVVDGFLGPTTVRMLMSSAAKPFGLRVGDESAAVTTVQTRLAHYGYLSDSYITGYYGSITEAAVKQFQQYNNLTVDGTVGTQTMSKLESSTATKKPASAPAASSSSSSGSTSSGTSSSSSGSSSSSSSVGSGGATVSGSAANLIAIAQSKLGCPYVYGAKGPNSFDCSGFVYWCLNQAGVNQSYLTSSGWRNPGRYQKVSSFDSIQAGDIIVVSGHVGIAAGGGTVIDASSSNGRVVHRSLSSWWRNNFIVAWRIFA